MRCYQFYADSMCLQVPKARDWLGCCCGSALKGFPRDAGWSRRHISGGSPMLWCLCMSVHPSPATSALQSPEWHPSRHSALFGRVVPLMEFHGMAAAPRTSLACPALTPQAQLLLPFAAVVLHWVLLGMFI